MYRYILHVNTHVSFIEKYNIHVHVCTPCIYMYMYMYILAVLHCKCWEFSDVLVWVPYMYIRVYTLTHVHAWVPLH